MRPSSLSRQGAASRARRARYLPRASRAVHAEDVSTVLGPDHPLTRAGESFERVRRQSLVAAAVLLGSIVALSEGAPWAAALALSATIVLIGLIVVATGLNLCKRDRVLDLIIGGREGVPIAAVQRKCERLRAPRTQRRIAQTIEGMIEQALNPRTPCPRSARPLFEVAVVASVAGDLRGIGQHLRSEHACVRGVALLDRLLGDGGSLFYGHQAKALREELHRIEYVMSV